MTSDNKKSISGQIAGVTLSSFLQMIEMEQKTCTIKIFSKQDLGRIFFLNGVLIDADTKTRANTDALYKILSWKNIVIEVEENTSKTQDRIRLPLMHILLESTRYTDENDGRDLDDAAESVFEPVKNIPLKVVRNNEFCLEMGVQLLIDFEGLAGTFRSSLVGIEPKKYLLLKAPSPFGRVEHDLFDVEQLTAKSLYKGTIYAFRSRLLGMINEPSKLMFVEYPKRIEHHELRSHKRFKCNIIAQIEVFNEQRNGVIENISRGGCLCVIESLSQDKKLMNNLLNQTLPFRCRLPGVSEEIRFTGEIKNIRKKSDEIAAGIQFVLPEDPDENKIRIENYIKLVESAGQAV